ncbi:hypothetical protein ASF74_07870 [Arthrobacter sp. Leaf145]|nr:hypothetical protein ASF74_07870 [Arthrobacter sp. Leaf145]
MRTVIDDLNWIYDRWSDLRATIHRGTPKPWREPTLTLEQRGRLDELARLEKLERGAFTLGESPAPIHLDALDRAIDLTATMVRLARAMATQLGHTAVVIRAARHRYDDPLLLIRYVRAHFAGIGTDHVELGELIEEEVARLRAGLLHHFSEFAVGQRLKAGCPWCDQPSLYVRLIGPEGHGQPIIRCESGTCNPENGDCGTWHRNMPAWPFHEWEWLSQRIAHAEDKRDQEHREALGIFGPTVEQEHGNVYVVQLGQQIKIGWTQNPRIRMRQLKPDAVLLSKKGTRQDETRLHHLFAEHRKRGREYFEPHPDILRFAEKAHAYDSVTAMLP